MQTITERQAVLILEDFAKDLERFTKVRLHRWPDGRMLWVNFRHKE